MTENQLEKQQLLSPEIISAKFKIALTKAEVGIQRLHDIGAGIEYNEDNLVSIQDFISKIRKAKSIIADEHKAIKEPFLRECQLIDSSKRAMDNDIDSLYNAANKKYTDLCIAVEKRKQEQQKERQRVADIKEGIEKNVLSFSQQIAECETSKRIVEVEKLIHIEKTRKNKYQEFLPLAIERFDSLVKLLSNQKQKVKQLEDLEKKKAAMEKANDTDEFSLLDLHDQIEEKKANIQEGAVNIQEVSMKQATESDIAVAEEINPSIKPRRSVWKAEVIDINELQKKMPHLVKLVADEEKISDLLKTKKADGSLDGKEELFFNGIRIYLSKTF